MTLRDALVESARDLNRRLEQHRALIEQAINAGEESEEIVRFQGCPLFECRHERLLKKTLLEAIGVLEETRRAFKSRQLEALRKKLIGVLAEDA